MTGESFQLIRFDPIGRVWILAVDNMETRMRFQLIRFNPIGRADLRSIPNADLIEFPTNPI